MGVARGLLDDIRGVQSRGQPAVAVDGDHPLQAVAVSGEQEMPRRVIAAGSTLDELVGVGSVRPRHRISALE
jgi:hypothetical protein